VLEIIIGVCLLVGALLPKAKFYDAGAPGMKYGPPIEPSWVPRLFFLAAGLTVLLDGIERVRHH